MPLKIKQPKKTVKMDFSKNIKKEAEHEPKFKSPSPPITNLAPPIIAVSNEKKMKSLDIQIRNTPEPKVAPNIKYSAKQSFRRYKTKTEPKLKSKLQIEEEDDMVKKIKEAFGIKRENTNYSTPITAKTAPIPVFSTVQDPKFFDNIYKGRHFNGEELQNKVDEYFTDEQKEDLDVYMDDLESNLAMTEEYKNFLLENHINQVIENKIPYTVIYDDDDLLIGGILNYNLSSEEKQLFFQEISKVAKEGMPKKEEVKLIYAVLETIINARQNPSPVFTKQSIPAMRILANINYKDALKLYKEQMTQEERNELDQKVKYQAGLARENPEQNKDFSYDREFIDFVKGHFINQILKEQQIGNITKEDTEDLLDRKANPFQTPNMKYKSLYVSSSTARPSPQAIVSPPAWVYQDEREYYVRLFKDTVKENEGTPTRSYKNLLNERNEADMQKINTNDFVDEVLKRSKYSSDLSALSEKSTNAARDSMTEITADDIFLARRKPGRPPTRPETLQKKAIEMYNTVKGINMDKPRDEALLKQIKNFYQPNSIFR